MTTKIFTRFVRTALVVATMASSQFVSAADVAGGSVVKLADGLGTYAGIFNGSVVSGAGAGDTFQSFCLEKNEYFSSYGQSLYVKSVGTATLNDINYKKSTGGTTTNGYNTIASDPLSEATAWLFTQFYSHKSTYAGTVGLADSFQKAIWYLEDELTKTEFLGKDTTTTKQVQDQWIPKTKVGGKWVAAHWTYKTVTTVSHTQGTFEDAQAKLWVDAAVEATTLGADNKDLWNGLGNVRVLNLFTGRSGSEGHYTYTGYSQDQLYMVTAVPEVETYALMLAGLGLVGAAVRRRKHA